MIGFVPSVQEFFASLGVTFDMAVVFGLILVAVYFFVTDHLAIDITAILLMVLLMVLEPWTQISPAEAISGFSNPATITVLAMLILSGGMVKTGVAQIIGRKLSRFAGENKFKQLFATVAAGGPISGFVNNTPVVAILVSVITDLAHKGKTSPSKLLIPLSYASMLGGTLTLIGTSTNILASEISGRLIGHPFSMFEFTKLGAIVLLVGGAYLLFIAPRLLPDRVPPIENYGEQYGLKDYVAEVVVHEESPLAGLTMEEVASSEEFNAEILQLRRGNEVLTELPGEEELEKGDVLRIHTDKETLVGDIIAREELVMAGREREGKQEGSDEVEELIAVEVVIPSGSPLEGDTLSSSSFEKRYDVTVLAIRSRGKMIKERLNRTRIHPGDTLLVEASPGDIDRLAQNPGYIVAHEVEEPTYRKSKIPHALVIILGVVLLASFGVFPILLSALAGVVAMVVSGVLKPHEVYDSVSWDVIFLLAGVIPLGMALEQTGGAELIGEAIAASAGVFPSVAVLWLLYITTGLITGMISNNASVALLIPVAVNAAAKLGANPFSFVLAVTFAASTAFLTPVGYQTNLFVYGPGGYRFSDYIRVGLPLQLILSVVTVAGIVFFWGL
ncbi:anion permease [Candidatus Bipolaricaulota bacterium]|nr:anion permease [Candidatus Bipolaricaulota bacterium]